MPLPFERVAQRARWRFRGRGPNCVGPRDLGHEPFGLLCPGRVARCASWFNPLAHLAARRFRIDQELACDATVIAARPTARRAYAEALLKTQVTPAYLPLGCTWTSQSARRLGERIAMLGRPSLSRSGAGVGRCKVCIPAHHVDRLPTAQLLQYM